MSDESSWSDLVEALASVPEKLARKHVWKIVCKIVWFDEKFDHLGKNKRRFVNDVVNEICKILARARLESDEPLDREYVPWLEEFLGTNKVLELPFNVYDIVVRLIALFELEWSMEPSEYEAKLAALQRELVKKLAVDMLLGHYFDELLDDYLTE